MSVLSELFGNCPQLKIIETFAENYNDKLYAADIVRMTGVHKATVHSHINKLLEEGLIEKKEKIGKFMSVGKSTQLHFPTIGISPLVPNCPYSSAAVQDKLPSLSRKK